MDQNLNDLQQHTNLVKWYRIFLHLHYRIRNSTWWLVYDLSMPAVRREW